MPMNVMVTWQMLQRTGRSMDFILESQVPNLSEYYTAGVSTDHFLRVYFHCERLLE